jgi:signal transduction histidine kinase
MEIKKYAILYVDDEESNLRVFKNTFRRKYTIYTALSASEGLKILQNNNINLIISDQRMPEMDGVEFLKRAMINNSSAHRILITAYSDFDAIKKAINNAKVFQYIEKPWDEKSLESIIDNALEMYDLRQKNKTLLEELRDKNIVLEQLNKKLREHDALKMHFLNIISHEIRTPLNGLVGAMQLFKENISDDALLKYASLFNMLEISMDRLEMFLLMAERITILKAGKYKIAHDIVQLRDFMPQIINELKEKIANKHIVITGNYTEKFTVFADKELLKICLLEIIDNAVKYSDEGGIVHVSIVENFESTTISVRDEGVGFTEIALNHIYEMFSTFDSLGSGGMGLDLALVKLIMDVHQGKITVQNNEHNGASVVLQFPFENAENE